MNIPSIIALSIVAVWFVLAVVYLLRHRGGCACTGRSGTREKKNGSTACSSCSACSGCSGCFPRAKSENANDETPRTTAQK